MGLGHVRRAMIHLATRPNNGRQHTGGLGRVWMCSKASVSIVQSGHMQDRWVSLIVTWLLEYAVWSP